MVFPPFEFVDSFFLSPPTWPVVVVCGGLPPPPDIYDIYDIYLIYIYMIYIYDIYDIYIYI